MSFKSIERIKTLNNPEHLEFEEVSCYMCGSNESEEFLVGEEDLTGKDGEFLYVKCKECSLVYQNPRIPITGIKEYYDSEYIAHRKKKDWGILTPLYEWAMGKGYLGHVMPQVTISDKSYSDIIQINRDEIDSWMSFDIRLGVTSEEWSSELFIENVTDERAEISNTFVAF